MDPLRWLSRSAHLSSHGRDLLRARTARYGLFAAAVGAVFWVSRAGSAFVSGQPLWTWSVGAHAVGVFAMALLWAVARSPRSSPSLVRSAELVCTTLACGAYCAIVVGLPQAFRPDAKLSQGLAIQLLGRAVYVPSSARRTLLLSALVTLPLGAALAETFAHLDPSFVASLHAVQATPQSLDRIRVEILGEDLLWWLGTVAVSTSVSAVIYGLRREVSAAKQLGPYTLLEEIGRGGMGVVHRARHALLRRETAIKLLPPERVGERSLERFEREVRATSALSHPNTVTIFDYGRTPDGALYYAMELLDGVTLSRVVELDGAQPVGRVVSILAQAASALAEAHEVDFIHRDIKPENLLLTRYGGEPDFVKVVDFGLVKELRRTEGVETGEHAILGTPLYMAPEVIRGEPVDARTDLYALGAVGYFLLTGGHVFQGRTVVELCAAHLERTPSPIADRRGEPVPEPLEALVMACLEKDPARRPASARELETALRACAGGWTRDDAVRWWRDFGPDLEDDAVVDAHARTLDVALQDRDR